VSPRPRLTPSEQDRILDATLEVIADRGLADTRLLDVGRALGRSTGTLQHYFGAREDLVSSAFRRLGERAVLGARALADDLDDPWERVKALLEFIVAGGAGAGDRRIWLEYWNAAGRDDRLRAEATAVYGGWRRLIGTAIRDGLRSGRFTLRSSAGEVMRTLLAVIDGMALHAALGTGGLTSDVAARAVVRVAAGELGVSA